MSPLRLLLGASLLVLAACDAPLDDDALSFREAPSDAGGPILGAWPPPGGTLNTASFGAMPLMRLLPPNYLNDKPPRQDDGAISLIQVRNGPFYLPVTAVGVPYGALVLHTAVGPFKGEEVIGSRWWLDEAKTHYLTISAVVEVGNAFGYELEHRYVGSEVAELICAPDFEDDHWAYLVEDVLVDVGTAAITPDEGPLLVACGSGALGKSITWGFSPWSGEGTDPLALYKTGVRTVMADYCGDGSSHTEDGTRIQVSNALAGQYFEDPEALTEAVFGPDGALCLLNPRIAIRPAYCSIPACEENGPLPSESFHAWTKLAPPLP